MYLVILESPYAGRTNLSIEMRESDKQRNILYARACMKDCLNKNEAPFLSHLLYTQVLNGDIEEERALGINAGLEWKEAAAYTVVYIDLGITKGMMLGIEAASKMSKSVPLSGTERHEIKFRSLENYEEKIVAMIATGGVIVQGPNYIVGDMR